MIWKLDDGIGKVVEALKDKRILDDTIIMFYSDNGGPTYGLFNNSGSNYPLRGVSLTSLASFILFFEQVSFSD